ncbi:MAG: PilZ domain-containing protein, partial [Deltaproteobacteria bacterium]|nr:PilZ domain-containing protein [Deltaproteobacteria bacterium]
MVDGGKESITQPTGAPVSLRLEYHTRNELLAAYDRTIHRGGLCIPTVDPFPLGQRVHLSLSLPGLRRELKVIGEVVWSNPGRSFIGVRQGMGIQLREMEAEDRMCLEACLLGMLGMLRNEPVAEGSPLESPALDPAEVTTPVPMACAVEATAANGDARNGHTVPPVIDVILRPPDKVTGPLPEPGLEGPGTAKTEPPAGSWEPILPPPPPLIRETSPDGGYSDLHLYDHLRTPSAPCLAEALWARESSAAQRRPEEPGRPARHEVPESLTTPSGSGAAPAPSLLGQEWLPSSPEVRFSTGVSPILSEPPVRPLRVRAWGGFTHLLALFACGLLFVSAFMPWRILTPVVYRTAEDPHGFLVVAIAALTLGTAIYNLQFQRNLWLPYLLLGVLGVGLAYLTYGEATEEGRLLVEGFNKLMQDVGLQELRLFDPAEYVGAGLYLSGAASLILSVTGALG